jgi:hypothetical protein
VRPSAEAVAPEPAVEPAAEVAPVLTEQRSYWPIASGILAVAWLVTVALWWRARGASPRRAEAGAPPPAAEQRPALRKILRDLESACAVGDPGAAQRALLTFAEARFPNEPPRSLGALAAALPAAASGEVLALEAHIYGTAAGAWRGDGLKAALPEVERFGAAPDRATPDPLLPLYR